MVSGKAKRKSEEAVSASNAAKKLLCYFVDARVQNENVDAAKIKAHLTARFAQSLERHAGTDLCTLIEHEVSTEPSPFISAKSSS